jgi:hypothetical protein
MKADHTLKSCLFTIHFKMSSSHLRIDLPCYLFPSHTPDKIVCAFVFSPCALHGSDQPDSIWRWYGDPHHTNFSILSLPLAIPFSNTVTAFFLQCEGSLYAFTQLRANLYFCINYSLCFSYKFREFYKMLNSTKFKVSD